MIKILLFLWTTVYAYDIGIVGANGRLGRELVYQATSNHKVIGYTSKPNYILEPYRGNGFNENVKMNRYFNDNLDLYNYWENIDQDYNHLIFCTSAKPFEKDYSYTLFDKFLNQISNKCKSISFVSAKGVGNSLKNSNLGIQIMNDWYLKDVYDNKNKIEQVISNYEGPIKMNVYKPNALSHGNTYLLSESRENMAKHILDNLYKPNP